MVNCPPLGFLPVRNPEWPCLRTQAESDSSYRYKKEVRPREDSHVPEVTQQFTGTAGAGELECWSLGSRMPVSI